MNFKVIPRPILMESPAGGYREVVQSDKQALFEKLGWKKVVLPGWKTLR